MIFEKHKEEDKEENYGWPFSHLHGAFNRLDHVDLVGGRRGRASQVVDLVHLAEKGEDDVVLVENKIGVTNPVLNVFSFPRE